MSLACEHGHLARQCPLCEKDAEIRSLREALTAAVDILETSAGNIRSFWPYEPYRLWLEAIEDAIAKGKAA